MKRLLTLFVFIVAFASYGFPQALTSPPVAINQSGHPIAKALVVVCTSNPGLGVCPGGNVVTLYSDITLAYACTGTLQQLNNQANPAVPSGCSNPGFADNFGNVVAYAEPGEYWCQYTGPSLIPYSQPCANSGGGGGGGSTVFYQGPPSGAINSSNTVYTLSPVPGSASDVNCFENGLQQMQGAGDDYTISGATLTWTVAPLSGYALNCQWLAVGSSTSLNQGAPSGAINGSNVTFTLSPAPAAAANVNCYLNGLQQLQGSGFDYTIAGSTLTWTVAPLSGYRLNCTWF